MRPPRRAAHSSGAFVRRTLAWARTHARSATHTLASIAREGKSVHCAALHCGRWALTHSLAGQCRTAHQSALTESLAQIGRFGPTRAAVLAARPRRHAMYASAFARRSAVPPAQLCDCAGVIYGFRCAARSCAAQCSAARSGDADGMCVSRVTIGRRVLRRAEPERLSVRAVMRIDSLWPLCAAAQRCFWPQLRLLWWQPSARPSLRRRLRRRTSHTSAPSRTPTTRQSRQSAPHCVRWWRKITRAS